MRDISSFAAGTSSSNAASNNASFSAMCQVVGGYFALKSRHRHLESSHTSQPVAQLSKRRYGNKRASYSAKGATWPLGIPSKQTRTAIGSNDVYLLAA